MLVLTKKKGPVTTIIINRPEVRNAVDGPTAEALVTAFEAFDTDPEARVAVFTGAGGIFCAGADLKALSQGNPNRLAEQLARFPQRCMRNDRRSAYDQFDLFFKEALKNEFRLGLETINSGETLAGAGRFSEGAGRHGKFGD